MEASICSCESRDWVATLHPTAHLGITKLQVTLDICWGCLAPMLTEGLCVPATACVPWAHHHQAEPSVILLPPSLDFVDFRAFPGLPCGSWTGRRNQAPAPNMDMHRSAGRVETQGSRARFSKSISIFIKLRNEFSSSALNFKIDQDKEE